MIDFSGFFRKRPSVSMRADGDTLTIFVHGLGGSALGTWQQMLSIFASTESLTHVAFDCYAYPTSLLRIPFFSRRPGVRELANGLRTYINVHHPDKKKILLVGHSLGGLVVRQYILDVIGTIEGRKLGAALLYAVPNSGAAWAYLSSGFSWNHIQAKQLSPSSDMIDNMNREWTRRDIENLLPVTYVIGGLDAVVAKESSAWSQGADHEIVIEHGHRTIVKPRSETETSFKILKKFVAKFSLTDPVATIPSFTKIDKRLADPLFDVYSNEVDQYYEVRKVDQTIMAATLGSHLWVSGMSGVGKTAALKRLSEKSGWNLEHIILSSYQKKTPDGLVAAICNSLYDRIGLENAIVPCDSDISEFLYHLEKIYAAKNGEGIVAILVEEIPLAPGDQYAKFLELVYHISLTASRNSGAIQIIWMFSSIYNPEPDINPKLKQFRERMQFIHLDRWTDLEMKNLLARIKSSNSIGISVPNARLLVAESNGNPRFMKMVLRRSRNEVGSKKPFKELIQSVVKDLN